MENLLETNSKKVQVLKSFVDHRGNSYFPGIYESGTLLILSLQKADYKVLEEDEPPVELEKEYNLQTTQKKTIQENNPKLTIPAEQLPEKQVQNLTKNTTRKVKISEPVSE